MKFYVTCATDHEDITLKINADYEEDAEAIALLNYKIKSVKNISAARPKQHFDSLHISSRQLI